MTYVAGFYTTFKDQRNMLDIQIITALLTGNFYKQPGRMLHQNR